MDTSTIKLNQTNSKVLDYKFLKQKGIEELQKLTGNIWTDYNIHDPGITILEILSYAITELGYRSQYSVKDILATKEKEIKDTLFAPSEILPSLSLTIKDFHKLLLDIEGIKDTIFYPSKKFPEYSGIYDINIELFPEFDDAQNREAIKHKVYKTVNQNRNLCEDFNEIKFIQYEPVIFEIDVDVSNDNELAEIYVEIYAELKKYLSPAVEFKSLQDQVKNNIRVDEIYNGPFLKSGFIEDSEFDRLDHRNIISASDIIHFIMDIKGVEIIRKLNIIDKNKIVHKWIQQVEKGKAFKLDVKNTQIRFFKLGKIVELKKDIAQEIYKIDKKEDRRLKHKRLTFPQEAGKYRSLKNYYSIQNDFPEVYGIGELGLLPSEPPKRKGQAKQLKAFLLFFEQVLTNFYAQLENLNTLFSIETISNTYYGQPIISIPNIEFLYQPFIRDCIRQNIDIDNKAVLKKEWKKHLTKNNNKINRIIREIIEDEETFKDRRNRILDHLLARLAFDYTEYKFDFEHTINYDKKLIKDKKEILKNFIKLSKERGRALNNIASELNKTDNISGLEYRINLFLKLQSTSKKFPFDFYKENFSIKPKINNKTNKEKDFSIIFKKSTKNQLVDKLFNYATNINNYEISENPDKTLKVKILDDDKNSFANFKEKFETQKKARRKIVKIVRKINKISTQSESIHIIERILYRPNLKMKYFSFSILYDDNTPAFINKNYLTFDERTKLLSTIINVAQQKDNYQPVKISKQYKIVIKDQEKELLISHKFFNSIQEVNKEIEYQIKFFSNISQKNLNLFKHINFYTKHYDLFQLSKDPYSFILTILIPKWPKKFQNEAFKSHLEQSIRKEIPAHIYPDIKWVGIDQLLTILDSCNKFQTIQNSEKPDYKELEKISDKLFAYFLER